MPLKTRSSARTHRDRSTVHHAQARAPRRSKALPVAILLALAGALTYGVADFCGGMASRRNAAASVTLVAQCAGLVVLAPAVLLVGGEADPASLAWGAAGGMAGALGLLLFYRGLATGPMAVIAPLTAVTAAVVPVLGGVATGERPSPAALVGVAGAVLAVLLVSAEGGRLPTRGQLVAPGTATALAAGGAFGLVFVLLSRSGHDSGMWPLVGARCGSIGLLVVLTGGLRLPFRVERAEAPLVLVAGVGDMLANVFFLLASRHGLLSIVGVLVALYPAGTVLLALLVLKERLAGVQLVGLAVALVAVALIAAT